MGPRGTARRAVHRTPPRPAPAAVTPDQAKRLATALRALLIGLSQGVTLGLAPDATERFFADAARALTAPDVLGPP